MSYTHDSFFQQSSDLSGFIDSFHPWLDGLSAWAKKSGLELKKFFNTSGLLYKSMNLREKLPTMTDEEKLQLLSTDGMLVKRPILVTDNTVLVGFKEEAWREALLK